MNETYSDIQQDLFAVTMLDSKRNGVFVDIGCNAPTYSSNTYLLEKNYDFSGVCIDQKFFDDFKQHRPRSKYIINDALTLNYKKIFEENNLPKQIDYLTVDIDPCAQSFAALTMLPTDYRFSVITFEYELPWGEVRIKSREYLQNLGYQLACPDMPKNIKDPFEDWYIDPTIINVQQLEKFKELKYE